MLDDSQSRFGSPLQAHHNIPSVLTQSFSLHFCNFSHIVLSLARVTASYNMASPAARPPTKTPIALGRFTTPAPVSAGTVALAVLDSLLIVELDVCDALVDVVEQVEECADE
jgi:hypothetical protein